MVHQSLAKWESTERNKPSLYCCWLVRRFYLSNTCRNCLHCFCFIQRYSWCIVVLLFVLLASSMTPKATINLHFDRQTHPNSGLHSRFGYRFLLGICEIVPFVTKYCSVRCFDSFVPFAINKWIATRQPGSCYRRKHTLLFVGISVFVIQCFPEQAPSLLLYLKISLVYCCIVCHVRGKKLDFPLIISSVVTRGFWSK